MFGLARTFRIDCPPGTPIEPLVDSLNQVTTVEAATPNYVTATPFATVAAPMIDLGWQPWQKVRATEALAYEPGDATVVVAIIDSGVAPSHPELPALRAGWDTVQLGQSELALGLQLLGDSTSVDSSPVDRHVGHGMGCAGIIGARDRHAAGVGWGRAASAQRALGAARTPGKAEAMGSVPIPDLDTAMKLAVDLGAKIINMSFGTDDSALSTRRSQAARRGRGATRSTAAAS